MIQGYSRARIAKVFLWNRGDFLRVNEKISALILVAGMSRRMGDFKPLLPLRGRTLIENSVDSVLCGGAETAVVVTGYRAEEVEEVLSRSFGERVCFVRNNEYKVTDMMTSVRIGVSALPECDAFFLLPGDMPVVSQGTFEKLIANREQHKMPLCFPLLEGYRKHPPLIDASMIPDILSYEGENGLRGLWEHHENHILNVPVDDAGVWIDIDTKIDYLGCKQKYEKETGGKTKWKRSAKVLSKKTTPQKFPAAAYM